MSAYGVQIVKSACVTNITSHLRRYHGHAFRELASQQPSKVCDLARSWSEESEFIFPLVSINSLVYLALSGSDSKILRREKHRNKVETSKIPYREASGMFLAFSIGRIA